MGWVETAERGAAVAADHLEQETIPCAGCGKQLTAKTVTDVEVDWITEQADALEYEVRFICVTCGTGTKMIVAEDFSI